MALAEHNLLAELDYYAALMPPGHVPDITDLFPAKPSWMAQATCHGRTDVFFSSRDEVSQEARELCQECPVRAPCLAYALDDPNLEGCWAGTSKRERRRMRRAAS